MAVKRGQKNNRVDGTLPKSFKANAHLTSRVKTEGVGGGKKTSGNRLGALKKTLRNARRVVRKMRA